MHISAEVKGKKAVLGRQEVEMGLEFGGGWTRWQHVFAGDPDCGL